MKKQTRYVVAMFALALFGGVVFAQSSLDKVEANVPFAFYVGKTELPAGPYAVYSQTDMALDLVIRNLNSGQAVVAPVITRLGTREGGKAELAFDKVGEKFYLSEVFVGDSDGFELMAAAGKHSFVAEKSTHGTGQTQANGNPGEDK